jgi:hypothetical protein
MLSKPGTPDENSKVKSQNLKVKADFLWLKLAAKIQNLSGLEKGEQLKTINVVSWHDTGFANGFLY